MKVSSASGHNASDSKTFEPIDPKETGTKTPPITPTPEPTGSDEKSDEAHEESACLSYHFGTLAVPPVEKRPNTEPYVLRSRRNSFFDFNERKYTYSALMNCGAENSIRSFKDKNSHELLVRNRLAYFMDDVKAAYAEYNAASQEKTFFHLLYPEKLYGITDLTPYSVDNKTYYTFREIFEKLTDTTLYDYFITPHATKEICLVFLSLARLLQYMHEACDFIHGDIHPDNILIDMETGEIYLIDFAYSQYIGHERTRAHQERTLGSHFPPEVRGATTEKNPLANPTQDVYQFGYMLNAMLENHMLYPNDCHKIPNFLFAIAENATNRIPNKRISFSDIIDTLKEAYTRASIADAIVVSAPSTSVVTHFETIPIPDQVQYFNLDFRVCLANTLRAGDISRSQLYTFDNLRPEECERLQTIFTKDEINETTFNDFLTENMPQRKVSMALRSTLFFLNHDMCSDNSNEPTSPTMT